MEIEKGQDYWYIQLFNTSCEIKADTYSGRDYGASWNKFSSRKDAEVALARIILLLSGVSPTEPGREEETP